MHGALRQALAAAGDGGRGATGGSAAAGAGAASWRRELSRERVLERVIALLGAGSQSQGAMALEYG